MNHIMIMNQMYKFYLSYFDYMGNLNQWPFLWPHFCSFLLPPFSPFSLLLAYSPSSPFSPFQPEIDFNKLH